MVSFLFTSSWWLAVVLMCCMLDGCQSTTIVSVGPVTISQGAFTFYYDSDSASKCNSVLFLGVGTAMKTTQYSTQSTEIIEDNPGMVVAVIDDNPGGIRNPLGMQKQDPQKYSSLVNELVANVGELLVPVCSGSTNGTKYLISGHSGSGQGAVDALTKGLFTFTPHGFVGLAPFKLNDQMKVDIPALFWGYTRTTCLVNFKKASLMGYDIANPSHRVLYQVQTHNWNIVTGGPHCIFSNAGCFRFCFPKKYEWVRPSVGKTIQVFVEALQDGFSRALFEAVLPNNTDLFFNTDPVG